MSGLFGAGEAAAGDAAIGEAASSSIVDAGVGATTGGSETASSAAGTSKAANVVNTVGSAVGSGSQYSPIATLVGFIQARRVRKEGARQFDTTFKENKRRWGLEWALQEWATRKGIAMDEAVQRYNQEMGRKSMDLQSRQVGSQLKSEALTRRSVETQMRWALEDREKSEKMGKAYSRGVISGILGRKA
jgi:hypothetical protein